MYIDVSCLNTIVSESIKPVVFFDTCTILDLFRIPIRKENSVIDLDNAINLIRNKRIHVVMSEIVVTETHNNINNVESELTDSISKLDEVSLKLNRAFEFYGISRPPFDSFSHSLLDMQTRRFVTEILGIAIKVKVNPSANTKGMQRQLQTIPPCRSKGKDNLKDCIIFEHYIECARNITDASVKKYFISSNSKEFGNPSDFNDVVFKDFDVVGIKYVNNYSWLFSEVNAIGA